MFSCQNYLVDRMVMLTCRNSESQTMKLYLARIKSYQLDLGIESSAFLDPRLGRTIQGIKRDHGEPDRRIHTPLTRPHLPRILLHLPYRNYDTIVTRVAFTQAFAGCLWVGEFTYSEKDRELGATLGNWFLTEGSVRILRSGCYMELTLRSSKTDPFRGGIKFTIAASQDEACAVQAMKELQAIDTHPPQWAPLFCIERAEQLLFTRGQVV